MESSLIEKRTYEFVGFEGHFGWTSEGEWSTMIWACFEKGFW